MRKVLLMLGLFVAATTVAQTLNPVNGVKDPERSKIQLVNANVITKPGVLIKEATILIENGKISSIVAKGTPLKGVEIIDIKGKYVYPAFIDPFSKYGINTSNTPTTATRRSERGPQLGPNRKGGYGANDAIKADNKAFLSFKTDPKAAAKLREAGIALTNSFIADGIARGTSAIVATGVNEIDNKWLLVNEATAQFSFNKGTSSQDYPSALMGCIALLRQTLYDANWYSQNKSRKTIQITDLSLEAINAQKNLPWVFETTAKFDPLRVSKLAKEFDINTFWVEGNGDEYQYIDDITNNKINLILPLNFPEAIDVEDPLDARQVSLAQLKHWELAPSNAAAVQAKGLKWCFTMNGLENPSDFLENIRKSVNAGLTPDQALAALTTSPAQLLQIDQQAGTLEPGKWANFIVTDSSFLEKSGAVLWQTWVMGTQYELKDLNKTRLSEKYTLNIQGFKAIQLTLIGTDQLEAKAKIDSIQLKISAKLANEMLLGTLESPDTVNQKGTIRFSAWPTEKNYKGAAILPSGAEVTFLATWNQAHKPDEKKKEELKKDAPKASILYPFSEYGYIKTPQASSFIVKNTTVWTSTEKGNLTKTDVWVENGKIKQIGSGLNDPNATVIDGSNMHLTPGLIDEHSHIAIARGVNEGTRSITSEVRIGDVLQPDDINIYRQLAGGVTTSHLLHGSANTIGGQTHLIKLRWGTTNPEALKFEGAPGFIKFALGENVKQSNWGEEQSVRFPQTRMGVEQIVMDGFTRAKTYASVMKTYNQNQSKWTGEIPRKDLSLDALVEIMNNKRHITCHSYVQSEINMLMKTADSLGFKVNTFTHILEGYKVADKMKKHGAMASTFSDWWAYKYEVIEAIPYNAALLTQMGVVTAINSDDAEMARRLNQEAAKAIKYGNLTEEQALALVTINPAKMLHIDQKTGSIAPGKDADLVLWNTNPLSIAAKPVYTWVDGVCRFDLKTDEAMKQRDEAERNRLIQAMIKAKKEGKSTQKPTGKMNILYHCDTEGY